MHNEELREKFFEFISSFPDNEAKTRIKNAIDDLFSADEKTHIEGYIQITETVNECGMQISYADQERLDSFIDEINEARYQ